MARQIVAALVALGIFLAQAVPMSASHNAGAGDWIVICSDEGAKLIQLDADDPNQDDCNHCPVCLISTNAHQGNLAAELALLTSYNFTNIFYGNAQTIGLTGPEQYWSACRGPPIASINNNMTTPFQLPANEQIRVVSNAWSVPCL